MNLRAVSHLVSYMLIVLALAMLACWGVAWFEQDPAVAVEGLLISGVFSLVAGVLLATFTRGEIDLSRRDGFGIVTLGWIVASLFGALPYILSGVILAPVPAVFETMSGFTTTGASVLTDLEQLPRGILLWRAVTHFFGGMGVLVLCVAILPFLGVGGMQIYRAEVPGPSKDRLTPRIANTAKLLWGVYVLLCGVEAALLRFGGMPWFDAVCHAFATMATGGFSTQTTSIAAYNSLYIEIVIIVFMFAASVNFALHYRALTGQAGAYWKDSEFRCHVGIWLGACLLLTVINWLGMTGVNLGQALRDAFFTGTSILTTTGFCTADSDLWPNASRVLLILLMFVGGCAGSTSGGIKVMRVMVVYKEVLREIQRFMQPQAIITVKMGDQPVPNDAVSHISAFFVIFLLLFGFFTIVMTFFTPNLETAFSSVIASMGNIGPGLNAVGATQNYAEIPPAGQAVLTFCMLLGRLELYTVLIVFLPGFWKR